MKPPIEIPSDLQHGDVVICNHGERLTVICYDRDGDLRTNNTTDWYNTWLKNGRNWRHPAKRWIVAIEHKTNPKKKPTSKRKAQAKPSKDTAYLNTLAVRLEGLADHIEHLSGYVADLREESKRLRKIASRLNKETP